ncbi:MAG: hypothetical protein K0R39_2751 [Symbiobacteriaceae bacterium]|jgi:hypothetical protein|nr:hypothetical protein [Symbiobacteriaceae bacterium]
MRYALQQRLTVDRLIWLFPVVFILHDLEEVFTMVPWMEQHPELMARLPFAPAVTTTAQVAGAVAFEWVLTFVAAYCGVRELRRARTHWFFMGLTAALFLNVFTHVGQGVLARGYIPGLWTAPTLLLPYMLYLYGRLRTAGLTDLGGLLRALVMGAPVGLAVVLVAHQVGGLLF